MKNFQSACRVSKYFQVITVIMNDIAIYFIPHATSCKIYRWPFSRYPKDFKNWEWGWKTQLCQAASSLLPS